MNRLKELRKKNKKTQLDIANLLQVNTKTVSRWENNEYEIKVAQARLLADYFGVSVGYLLGYEEGGGQGKVHVAKEIYNDIQKYSESFETIYDSQAYAYIASNYGTEVLDKVINTLKEEYYSSHIVNDEDENFQARDQELQEEYMKKIKNNIDRSINDLLGAISFMSGFLEVDLINYLSLDSEKRELLSPIIKLIANNPPTDHYAELINKY